MTGDVAERSRARAAGLEGRRRPACCGLPISYIGTRLLLICAGLARPKLLQPFLLMLILRQAAPLGLAVLGQSLCIRMLSLDLSFGGVAMAVSYILTSGCCPGPSPCWSRSASLLGLAVGALNAFFITQLRASSVIVTLAMVLILSGVVTAFSQFRAPGDAPDFLRYIGQTRIGIVPLAPSWSGSRRSIPIAIFLRRSVFGRYLDAIGANPRAAWASGVPYVRVVYAAHILSSLFAVLSAFLLLGFVGFGSLSIGSDLALNSLAAVILGGVTFGSGKGGVLGPAVAAFMLMFVFNLLTSFGLGEPGKEMAQGAIIALAAIAYSARGARGDGMTNATGEEAMVAVLQGAEPFCVRGKRRRRARPARLHRLDAEHSRSRRGSARASRLHRRRAPPAGPRHVARRHGDDRLSRLGRRGREGAAGAGRAQAPGVRHRPLHGRRADPQSRRALSRASSRRWRRSPRPAGLMNEGIAQVLSLNPGAKAHPGHRLRHQGARRRWSSPTRRRRSPACAK